jgi:hypothetical protein
MKNILFLAVFLSLFSALCEGQSLTYFPNYNVPGVLNSKGDTLKNAWGGGMANPTFSNIDLDFDGNNDLFIFDHQDSTIATYLYSGKDANTGKPVYKYAPEYASLFPSLIVWATLVDYNHDGLPDIFAYSHERGGIEVYKNVSKNNVLQFKLVNPFIWLNNLYCNCFGAGGQVYADEVDIPSFLDMDGDSDIDIVTMDVFGVYVNVYKNRCHEKFGHNYKAYDSLYYELSDNQWGAIQGQGGTTPTADSSVYPPMLNLTGGIHCNKMKHAGSNLAYMDLDGDKDIDAIYSDINGAGLCKLTNGRINNGKTNIKYPFDSIIRVDTPYLNICPFFPAAFHVDVDNNKSRDLIVSPMQKGAANESIRNVHYYNNSSTDDSPVFKLVQNDFLQEDEIDLGEGASPAFLDRNKDGVPEFMAVATHGNLGEKTRGGDRLVLYKNITTLPAKPVFKLVNNDWLGLSKLKETELAPAFGDMDNDGLVDLLVGRANGNLIFYHNTGTSFKDSFSRTASPNIDTINVGSYSTPAIGDLNNDGIADLLIGNMNGTFYYFKGLGYKTSGSVKYLDYELVNANLGNVRTVDTFSGYDGGSAPVLMDIDKNGKLDLLSGSLTGNLYLYMDIENSLNGTFKRETNFLYSPIQKGYTNPNFGTLLRPAVAQLDGDTIPDIIIGNNKGGIYYYGSHKIIRTSGIAEMPSKQFSIYPNPASNLLNIASTEPIASCQLINILGQTLLELRPGNGANAAIMDVSGLTSGMYIVRLQNSIGEMSVQKVLVGR